MPIDPRRRDAIAAAVAAYNVARRGPPLPPAATNLLTGLFASKELAARADPQLVLEGWRTVRRTIAGALL